MPWASIQHQQQYVDSIKERDRYGDKCSGGVAQFLGICLCSDAISREGTILDPATRLDGSRKDQGVDTSLPQ